uniref:Uncharacterized protein n=1 Tax=Anguilla anguilla TaxID=7936 RepID=A0A0E9SAV8_ANGAN
MISLPISWDTSVLTYIYLFIYIFSILNRAVLCRAAVSLS